MADFRRIKCVCAKANANANANANAKSITNVNREEFTKLKISL